MQTTITNKWQIHIPQAARKALNLTKPGKFSIKTEKNRLVLIPLESRILKLAGKYKKYAKGKKINLEKIRDYIDYSQV